ncbi:MAG: DNA polymerase III subunit alpha [Candidatus Doudnabacteria bacterium]|nr:DNA polymerase III subunit alpha [Candidatus Doudnabacteria bacterium]
MDTKFVHLHAHSHYSLLDGLPKIEDLIAAAKQKGFEALALTDHGVMHGAIEFYNGCIDAGIKPVIGAEVYISPRNMEDKEGKIDADYFHLTLLAQNEQGYKNLMKLVTLAHIKGFYYKPRIDLTVLSQHSEGLIALSGCQRGEVARAASNNSEEQTAKVLQKYLAIFTPDNFYIEIQRNSRNPNPREDNLNNKLIKLAQANNLNLVATADTHYINEQDSEAHDTLLCIGMAKTVNEEDRIDMRGYDLSLKSAQEMAEKFKDVPEALENTVRIAEDCQLIIKTNQRYFPKVEVPEGKTTAEYLRELALNRAAAYYGKDGQIPEAVMSRINYELDIIVKTGFDTYFLMVADVVDGAHSVGAITNTRGSAAGSIVGRILGITNVDPIYYELPFERFLTEHRPTPPDIDLDIADNRRDEVIGYITNKYGKDKVAQIITFGTMMARAAIRDVGRALGVPYSKCDQIAKMVPFGKQGFHMTLDKALDLNVDLKDAYEKDPETKKILDIARKLEGNARHASVHAAGVVITPTELTDYMPLQLEPDGDRVTTQYDMYALDVNASGSKAIGVVKLDLLGIRNLSILEEAVRIAKKRHGIVIDIYNLPHPDKKTFKLLSDGHTFGVFQLGSSGMTRYLKELKPNTIFDIMAMIALYRPGPLQFIPDYIKRKHNPRLIQYMDPSLEKILKRTYGILVYQDDLLTIAHDLAGYSWEEVDKFRKAVGKKIPAEMAKQKEKFINGCIKTSGWSKEKAAQIWAWIEPFAAYGFNKSHSASYCVVSYQTAYMKANYTVEFMAALMTAESGDMPTIVDAVEECRNLEIEVLPPNINESLANFTVIDEGHIRFGLNAIKNLGSDVIKNIIEQRKANDKFKDLEDFITRTHTRNFNKKSWEALVKSGALDTFGERNQLLGNTEAVLEFARNHTRSIDEKQTSLFGNLDLPAAKLKMREVEPATEKDKLAWEKELLGLYVTAHPLDEFAAFLKQKTKPIKMLDQTRGQAIIGGIINKVQKIITKKGELMAFIELEDLAGSVEVLVFPSVYQKHKDLVVEEKIVLISGKVSDKDGITKFLADDIKELSLSTNPLAASPIGLTIPIPEDANDQMFLELKKIFELFPGGVSVDLMIKNQKVKTAFRVNPSDDFKAKLKELIGLEVANFPK